MCREQMPEWNAGVFEDPRMEVHYTDAHAYLKNCDETFDVIIMDIADPIEAGPGYVLYTGTLVCKFDCRVMYVCRGILQICAHKNERKGCDCYPIWSWFML